MGLGITQLKRGKSFGLVLIVLDLTLTPIKVIFTLFDIYRPSWYVARIMHQTRMARVETPTESAKLVRMPQSFTLQRERIFP